MSIAQLLSILTIIRILHILVKVNYIMKLSGGTFLQYEISNENDPAETQ